ncbi:MAG: hypothetical protein J1F38_04015 [Muribaculaceae bacterium]|nr:hypothetical protein [Muribaculaceae bacterium]
MRTKKILIKFFLIALICLFIPTLVNCGGSKENNNDENVEVDVEFVGSDDEDSMASSQENVEIVSQEFIGVDLGLPSGNIWASSNLGAKEPWDYGDYYTLGVNHPGSMIAKDYHEKTKGIGEQDVISGDQRYDAAAAVSGSRWRTPSYSDFKELKDNCTWKWTVLGGHQGYWVIGSNGNSIFFPAAGSESSHLGNMKDEKGVINEENKGYYMFYSTRPTKWLAGRLSFEKGRSDLHELSKASWDHYASNIRPITNDYSAVKTNELDSGKYRPITKFVYTKPTGVANGHGYVDLGLPSGTKWATLNIGANEPIDEGDSFCWGRIIPDEEYYRMEDFPEPPSFFGGNPTHDAATALWGDSWKIPSQKNIQELIDNCQWVYMSTYDTNDKNIYMIGIGPNRNTIILPASDEVGSYWSTSLSEYEENAAATMYIVKRGVSPDIGANYIYYRSLIRPVLKKG